MKVTPILAKLLGYFLTAGTAAVVDIGGFVLLTDYGLPILIAATSSFAAAAVVNYLLSSRFVFKSKASSRRFLLFLAASLVGLAVNVGITFLAATNFGMPPAVAKIAGVGVAFLVNFAVNTIIVFPSARTSA